VLDKRPFSGDCEPIMDNEEKRCCPPATPKPELPGDDDELNERLAELAKALGHPARVAILKLLMSRDSCICGEIVEQIPLAQSTVSQHLKKMRDAGLIRGDVDGPRVCYCVEPGTVELFKDMVALL
jgi:ArsR family transcriptional regulator